ncbi:MAG: carboxymuconolactone decarboxylase family protein [Christensenella sp.]|uniref:carboxymuconolactone decarboxylase family protein n=1 Tax=Christensenella sp. TaxID=1935934 RepID=UPI002B210CC5|nr:carboxymuconolactone decarboxylase family protein [Christensenella sp.]MEA5002493.1 carboxymuconolactone decarboxylase family protein [Christensenella sp.]
MKIIQTAGRDALGEFAPQFAAFNDDVLFGEVWSSDGLPLKERSMITIAAFMGRGLVDSSFQYHLETAKKNGMTQTEIAEIITQLAFYIGWPMAWAAFNLAKKVWTDTVPEADGKSAHQNAIFFPIGEPNDAYAEYFVGQSYLAPISTTQVPIYNVTFEPGCRNNWHIHEGTAGGGQMLIGVGGRGYYQAEGEEAVEILPGTIINIPVGVKHWHGAAPDSWFSHLAVEIPGEATGNTWLEAVSDADYGKLK